MFESEIIASSQNQPMLASPRQLQYCCTVRGRNNGSITSSPAPSVYLAFHVHNVLLSLSVSENMTPAEQSPIHCFKKMSQHMKKKQRLALQNCLPLKDLYSQIPGCRRCVQWLSQTMGAPRVFVHGEPGPLNENRGTHTQEALN